MMLSVPMPAEHQERCFPGLIDQAGEARAFVAGCLVGLACRDDVVLATSELVSNALLYTESGQPGGKFSVRVSRSRWSVVVHVHEQGHGVPELDVSAPAADQEHGRGLLIVASLSTAWGCVPAAVCLAGETGRCWWLWRFLRVEEGVSSTDD